MERIVDVLDKWYKINYEKHPHKIAMYELMKKLKNEDLKDKLLNYITLSEDIITKSLHIAILSEIQEATTTKLLESETKKLIKTWQDVL